MTRHGCAGSLLGRWLVAATLFGLVACEREPAIIVRFDPTDLASVRDLGRPVPGDAAAPVAAAVEVKSKLEGKPSASAKSAECKLDADCVIVPDGCCGCANGGKQRGAAKKDEAALRAAQRTACKDVMCTMMVSTNPSCGKRATCLAGVCAMRDARPDERPRKLGSAPQ